jgi:hypothetical protein
LFGFLDANGSLRLLFEAFANCVRDYRANLMLINHDLPPPMRAARSSFGLKNPNRVWSFLKMKMARRLGRAIQIQYLNSGIALS